MLSTVKGSCRSRAPVVRFATPYPSNPITISIMTDRTTLQAGESVCLSTPKNVSICERSKPGDVSPYTAARSSQSKIIGLPEGSRVRTSSNMPYWVFRPTYAHLIPNLPRRAQVIYPKDTAIMLLWGDIFPGASVVEIGAGPWSTHDCALACHWTDGKTRDH